jgi:hypothetical protein
MTLSPTDMLEIQTAIDAYERKFPRRPPPSAEEALAWRIGRHKSAKRAQRQSAPAKSDSEMERQLALWVKRGLLVGWWSVLALVAASIFFFGAMVGALK